MISKPKSTASTSASPADGSSRGKVGQQVDKFLSKHELPKLDLTETLDLFLFGYLIDEMCLEDSVRAFEALKAEYVDWNEVRISTLTELSEIFEQADDPIDFTTGVKEFLNRLFKEHHHVGMDFLRELGNMEIKTYFKRTARAPESAILLLLERLKDYPTVPLTPESAEVAETLGWVSRDGTLLQKQKELFAAVSPEQVLPLHVFLLEHARGNLEESSAASRKKKASKAAKAAAKKNASKKAAAKTPTAQKVTPTKAVATEAAPAKAAATTQSADKKTSVEEVAAKKVTPKKVAPKKVATKKVATKTAATKKAATKKTAPKKVAKKKTATKKVAKKKAATKKVAKKAKKKTT